MASSQQEDLEMAKLQKKIRRQQQRSLQHRNTVTKLTPAEIRSLNHSVALAKDGSNSPGHNPSTTQSRSDPNTPPLTPENALLQHHPSRTRSANPPTPPQSPDAALVNRQKSTSAAGPAHIHAPKPRTYNAAQFVNRGPSRPSSASSYRGMQTYRGPEVTRTGSITMLHQPPPDIVSNPLSQFSRPRRSQTGTSPDRRDSRHSIISAASQTGNGQSQVITSDSSIRRSSPARPNDSPVSVLEVSGLPIVPSMTNDSADLLSSNQEKPLVSSEGIVMDDVKQVQSHSSKSSWSWRRSLGNQRIEDEPVAVAPPKKTRRRTISFSKSQDTQAVPYTKTKPGAAPEMKESLRADLPSAKTPVFSEEKRTPDSAMFAPHPGVRPLTLRIPSDQRSTPTNPLATEDNASVHETSVPFDTKGKGKDSEEAPIYGRCSCCGKLKKPNGFHSELSPVMENENLRTNFALEADRVSGHKNRSSSISSSNRQKYTPIIPLAVSDDKTVQATIEPASGAIVNECGDIIASNAEPVPILPGQMVDPNVVRFSSLHIRGQAVESTRDGSQANFIGNAGQSRPPANTSITGLITQRVDVESPLEEKTIPSTASKESGHSEPFNADAVRADTTVQNVIARHPTGKKAFQITSMDSLCLASPEIPIHPSHTDSTKTEPKVVTDGPLITSATADARSTSDYEQQSVRDDVGPPSGDVQSTNQIHERGRVLMRSKPEEIMISNTNNQEPRPASSPANRESQLAESRRSKSKSGHPVLTKQNPNNTRGRTPPRHVPGMSFFKRHRKSSSESKIETGSSPGPDVPMLPKVNGNNLFGANGSLTLPMNPPTMHDIVTTTPEIESKDPVAVLMPRLKPVVVEESSLLRPRSEPVPTSKLSNSIPSDQAEVVSQLESNSNMVRQSQSQASHQAQASFPPNSPFRAMRYQNEPLPPSRLSQSMTMSQREPEAITDAVTPVVTSTVALGAAKAGSSEAEDYSESQPSVDVRLQEEPVPSTQPHHRLRSYRESISQIQQQQQMLLQQRPEVTPVLSESESRPEPVESVSPSLQSNSRPIQRQTSVSDTVSYSGSESDRGIEPDFETKPLSIPPLSFQLLPEPTFGPHFARSNATLRDFVLFQNKSNSNLVDTMMEGQDDHDNNNNYEIRSSRDRSRHQTESSDVVSDHAGMQLMAKEAQRREQEIRRNRILDEERRARERFVEEVMSI